MADKTIVQLLNDVAAQVGAVGKSGRNTQQGYSFRGVDAVVNAAFPALRKHGVLITPNLRSHHYSTVEVGKNRTPMAHVVVEVEYTFHGPAGDTIVCSAPGEAMDSGDKATPKAMSVAYRTALLQALTLPTDEPDPDEDTYERSHPQPEVPVFDLTAWAATAVQMFKEWDADRRKAEWVEAVKDTFGDRQPKNSDEGRKVIDAMSKVYFAEFPSSDERPS